MSIDPFVFLPAQGPPLPILVSSPHSGTEIPEDIAKEMEPRFVARPPDTDWFIHELYRFCPSMGIGLIHAPYSRYVIDLNRSPDGKLLYQDQRFQTKLVPNMSFSAEALYRQHSEIDATEVRRRLALYYHPYYEEVTRRLEQLLETFPRVLFFDAHSIKRRVPSIHPKPFPDLILGDREGRTCRRELSASLLSALSEFEVSHNVPFQGGNLTLHMGNLSERIEAVQLEMSQDIYMEEGQASFDLSRASQIQEVLKRMFQTVSERINR